VAQGKILLHFCTLFQNQRRRQLKPYKSCTFVTEEIMGGQNFHFATKFPKKCGTFSLDIAFFGQNNFRQ